MNKKGRNAAAVARSPEARQAIKSAQLGTIFSHLLHFRSSLPHFSLLSGLSLARTPILSLTFIHLTAAQVAHAAKAAPASSTTATNSVAVHVPFDAPVVRAELDPSMIVDADDDDDE